MNNSPILNDYVFKQVFGQEDNNPILISFLNAMLDGDVNVKEVKILNSELPRIWELGRAILLDVQVKTDDGTYIDVEVQNGYKEDLADRMVVYGANMITRYSEKSTKYSSDKCIAIWILNCNIPVFKQFGNDPIIGSFDFKSRINPSNYLQMKELTIYPVQLRKELKVLNLSPEKQTWINFLRTSENNSTPVEIGEIHCAYDKMKITTGSDTYRNYEEAARKMDRLKAIEIEDAKNEGLAEGLVEGLEKGENKAKIETAKNFLKMGLSIEQISSGTGLSIEEVKELM